jgi:hypothetical protein
MRRLSIFIAVTATILIYIACRSQLSQQENTMQALAKSALDLAVAKYALSAANLDPADGYPRNIAEVNQWTTTGPGSWTSGFYSGILWYL